MYRSVCLASSLRAALNGEMRVLARLAELAKRVHRGGRVRMKVFLNILCRESNVRERQNNPFTAL